MANLCAFQQGGGSPSRLATSEDLCGFGDGKPAGTAHAIPPSPAPVGKPISAHDVSGFINPDPRNSAPFAAIMGKRGPTRSNAWGGARETGRGVTAWYNENDPEKAEALRWLMRDGWIAPGVVRIARDLRVDNASGREVGGRSGIEPRPSRATWNSVPISAPHVDDVLAYGPLQQLDLRRKIRIDAEHRGSGDKNECCGCQDSTSLSCERGRPIPPLACACEIRGLISHLTLCGSHLSRAICCSDPGRSGTACRMNDICDALQALGSSALAAIAPCRVVSSIFCGSDRGAYPHRTARTSDRSLSFPDNATFCASFI